MEDQIIFKGVFKNSDKETNGDDWVKVAIKLKKDNKHLKLQLEDVDSLIEKIEYSLDLGPDNDWARHAIERYKDKYQR